LLEQKEKENISSSLFILCLIDVSRNMQVITNFSRATTKVLEASFQLNDRHIFLVNNITTEVQKYLSLQPSIETVKATPLCYLKSMEKDGPVIASKPLKYFKQLSSKILHVLKFCSFCFAEAVVLAFSY
jgi:hypothetical protein